MRYMNKNNIIYSSITILIFTIGILIGVYNHENILEIARIIYNLSPQGGGISLNNKLFLFIFIFTRNTITTTLNISLGPIFGLFPLFSLLINGYLIGGIVMEISKSYGFAYALKGILPHGIFEIPAYLYSSILGFRIAHIAIKNSFKGEEFINGYINSLYKELKIVVPLLLIAAFIEAFITTALLGH